MEYSIYKDSDVNNTVKRIKNILNSIGIETKAVNFTYPLQNYKMPSSIALFLFNEFHESNGKGTTLSNAMASAYSEFMERLQNNYSFCLKFGFIDFKYAPDEVIPNEKDKNFLRKYYGKTYSNYLYKILQENSSLYSVPYYSIKKHKTFNIPIAFIYDYQSANGMSAGNTPEEAIVQGLSEIYERYAMKRIIYESVSMPDIPESVWGKYERIRELKEYIEEYGYEVQIKDASLGRKLPVVCTLFRHKEKEFFGLNFGSQPSLPIAIERTFTEFMQCVIPDEILIGGYFKDNVFMDKDYLYKYCTNVSGSVLMNTQAEGFYTQLFDTKPNYKFNKNAWVSEGEKYTNKELLKFLLTNPEDIKDKDIYVRDVSFLGFPSYSIYIPNMSELYISKDPKELECRYNFEYWKNYTEDTNIMNKEIRSLIKALEFKVKYTDYFTEKQIISKILNEYLLLLCYIVIGETSNVKKYCKILLKKEEAKIYHKRVSFIKDYYTYKAKYSEEETRIKLEKKYKKEHIAYFVDFIKTLTFEKIKERISTNNKKTFPNIVKNNPVNKRKVAGVSIKNEDEENIYKKIEKIKQNLVKRYNENIPNQMELSKVFDFIE